MYLLLFLLVNYIFLDSWIYPMLFRQTLECGPKSYEFVQFFNNQRMIFFGFLQRQIDCDDPN